MTRFVRSALIASVMVLLVLPAAAQMSTGQAGSNATVQPGPQVRPGLPYSADVFVNGKFAMRIPASAGGLSPMQRARRVASRLNQAFAAGASWQDATVSRSNGEWSVMLNNRVIITADANSARAYRISTGQLAARWARQTVVAMGGQPQMIAQQITPAEVAVAGQRQEIGQPPTTPSGPGAVTWSVTPTKSVPVLDASTGEQIGTVMVAGPRTSLNAANAVVVYTRPADSGTAYLMIPITGTSTTGTLTRAQGVGVVSIPMSLVPTDNILTGSQLPQLSEQMTNNLLAQFRNQTRDLNLATGADATVVPLYSMDMNDVVGAAYVVGNAVQIARTHAVVMSATDSNTTFRAVTNTPPISGTSQTLNNVVLSGIVVWTTSTPGTSGTASPQGNIENEGPSPDESAESNNPAVNPNAPETSTEPGTPGSNF